MFDIKITGLDEAIKKVEDMANGLTEKGINKYCDKIKQDTYTKCNLKNNEIKLEAMKTGDNITINFNVNSSKLKYVKLAIQENLTNMPITTKTLFEQLIKSIDKKITEQN